MTIYLLFVFRSLTHGRRWASSLLFVLALTGLAHKSLADETYWIRYPAIAPDAQSIAFVYRGDLWRVSVSGGEAQRLTSHESYDSHPVWSFDGKQIAFQSNRFGNADVMLMPSQGGPAVRLTFHSTNDTPTSFTRDNQRILFTSFRQDLPQAAVGHPSMGELYEVSVNGNPPRQLFTTPAQDATPSPDGRYIAYHDYKGYEDQWRKHHVSSVTRDLWRYDRQEKSHEKLTTFRGEDRNPVWTSDGSSLFFLSERNGSFNVWHAEFGKFDQAQQVTAHTTHPVRFLSIAQNDTIAYAWNGQLWIKTLDADPQRVHVRIVTDDKTNDIVKRTERDGATEMAVSPKQDEIAFVLRGDVFVTSVEYATTKRITNTPQQERSVVWAPDGRKLYYAGERDGAWNLYETSITRENEDRFSASTLLTESPLLEEVDESFQPVLSPNGKHIAYLHNRDEIRLLEIDTRKTSSLVPAKRNYSYSDGDIRYSWSPDSRWLAFTYAPHHRWLEEIGVVQIATGEITNITNSGYAEGMPKWSPDGRALFFVSDRLGQRNHGSWGTEDDVFALYLNRDAWEWINLSKEDLERRKRQEEKEKKSDSKSKKKDASSDGEDDSESEEPAEKEDDVTPLKIEFENREHRIKRITLISSPIGSFAISPDGETIVYTAEVDDKQSLWMTKIRDRQVARLATVNASEGEVTFAEDGKSVFVRDETGKLFKVTVPETGSGTVTPIPYAAELEIDLPAERAYIFEHAWRQVKRKFYREDLHGVDWQAMKENYQPFLPSIRTSQGFVELLSEMLGELNASHTGGRYRPEGNEGDQTPSLGLLYDLQYNGAGLKVAEVLSRGPADLENSKIAPGVLITHLDGERLTAETNPFRLLNNKAGKKVRLGLAAPDNGEEWEEVLEPISLAAEQALLYDRWIDSRRDLVDKLSHGRLGYVHVRGMNDASFRHVYKEVLGRNSDKEAIIIDTRFNGGGWLHDDLVSFLSGKDYIYFQPRGKEVGDLGAEPAFRWSRPSVVVQSESNYSDAHMFPYAYHVLQLGKLVGTPVPGTGTAVWWERQIDPDIIFGIPQVGMVTAKGEYLENLELQPDVEVYNTPESLAEGRDLQIEAAVDTLLKELGGTSETATSQE